MNTAKSSPTSTPNRFTGNHAATLTVTIDRPYYATVQLNVWGDIRGDIEVQSADTSGNSGLIEFRHRRSGRTRKCGR